MSVKTAVVICLEDKPVIGTGGPLAAGYLLLEHIADLVEEYNIDLYCLTLNNTILQKIHSKDDVRQLAVKFGSPSSFSAPKIRNRFRQVLPYDNVLRRLSRYVFQYNRERRLKRAIRQLAPSIKGLFNLYDTVIFHAQGPIPLYYVSSVVKQFAQARLIFTEHSKGSILRERYQNVGEEIKQTSYYRWIHRIYEYAFKHSHCIVFPSQGAVDLFESYWGALDKERITVVHNGISEPTFNNVTQSQHLSSFSMLTIAQHVPEKGLDRIVRSLGQLGRDGPNWVWNVIGGFTDKTEELKKLVSSLGLSHQVHFLGQRLHEEVLHQLRLADIIISFPRVVVFDLALLEAMALAKPIITSQLPGNVEALGEDYPLFARNENELTEKLAKCLSGQIDLHTIGWHNRQRYRHMFTGEAMARRYLVLFQELSKDVYHRETEERKA